MNRKGKSFKQTVFVAE